MATEIEGKIIQELPMQSGVSKAGREWKKREWVLETFGNYPRKVKFHIFGDRADQFNIVVGNNYRLQVDIESREFNVDLKLCRRALITLPISMVS